MLPVSSFTPTAFSHLLQLHPGGFRDSKFRSLGFIQSFKNVCRLKWYGHILRREDEYVGKRVMAMEVPGNRSRGRPKWRWLDSIRNGLSERELSREDAQDRARWRRLIRHIDPT